MAVFQADGVRCARKVIFIVESDRDCRIAIAELLSLQGYRVLHADNAIDVLKMLCRRETAPTVILVDPVIPARSAGSFPKQRPCSENCLYNSAALTPELGDATQESTIVGSVTYLRKPINPGKLMQVVARFIEKL